MFNIPGWDVQTALPRVNQWTVGDLLAELSELNPAAALTFCTAGGNEPEIVSIYGDVEDLDEANEIVIDLD